MKGKANMNLINAIILAFSGAIIVASIIIAQFGFMMSALSRRSAILLASIGVGIGAGLFVYYGVSEGDLSGSIFVGIFAIVVTVMVTSITLRKK